MPRARNQKSRKRDPRKGQWWTNVDGPARRMTEEEIAEWWAHYNETRQRGASKRNERRVRESGRSSTITKTRVKPEPQGVQHSIADQYRAGA